MTSPAPAPAPSAAAGSPATAPLPPVALAVEVPLAPDDAFALFVDEIGAWWPLGTHSLGGAETRACRFDAHVGGQLYEVVGEREERRAWGRVLAFDRPRRIVFSWHLDRPEETAQEVEVRFAATADGTRVELEHRGWERLADGATQRGYYEQGWKEVLGKDFGGAARSRAARPRPGG
jgi:uncharacterized protein YndB with AHSA1/START domain